MSKATHILAFVIGAVIGSVATCNFTKNKYEQLALEEINSVKEVFRKRKESVTDVTDIRERAEKTKEKPGLIEYAAKLQKEGYTNYSEIGSEDKKEETESMEDKPYVISPDDFGEFDEYEKISLTYYSDQVLADDNDEIVDDVESTIGFESLNRFGEYEDDSVFVRNDRLKCDYEILLDQRKYSDVIKQRPHPIEE